MKLPDTRNKAFLGAYRKGYLARVGSKPKISPYDDNRTRYGGVTFYRSFQRYWREGWEDGELCGYNRGREHNETDLEVVRNAGIQEGIERGRELERMREYPVHEPDCDMERYSAFECPECTCKNGCK